MTVVGNPDYAAYLDGPDWRKKRQERLEHDDHKCVRCSTTERLEVHHITYERIGRERLTDLLTVCADCHRREHGRDPSLPAAVGPGDVVPRLRERAELHIQQENVLEEAMRAAGLSEEEQEREWVRIDARGYA